MSASDRFWSKVDKSKSCWIWTAATSTNGYGVFAERRGNQKRAHRVAYEMEVGPIPRGMVLDHRCHNRLCVNPGHLRPVTQKQNGEHRAGPPLHSRTGVLGVSLREDRGLYVVRVGHNGEEFHGGQFATLQEAAEAARQLRLSLFTHNDVDRAKEPTP